MKTKLTKMQRLNMFFQMLCDETEMMDNKTENNKNKSNSKKQKTMKGRKGNVVVNGRVLTGKMYQNAAIESIKTLTAGKKDVWLTTATIIEYASSNLQMDTKNRQGRKAKSHPLYKHMTNLIDEGLVTRRRGLRGRFEYRLNK